MREFKLPSGAVLKVMPADFSTSKALYQAVLNDARSIKITSDMQLASVFKDLFCVSFSSPEIERCLWECMKKCTYNSLKIDKDTFEPVAARDDYMSVCVEVAKENILPFVKSLYAEFQKAMTMAESIQA